MISIRVTLLENQNSAFKLSLHKVRIALADSVAQNDVAHENPNTSLTGRHRPIKISNLGPVVRRPFKKLKRWISQI